MFAGKEELDFLLGAGSFCGFCLQGIVLNW